MYLICSLSCKLCPVSCTLWSVSFNLFPVLYTRVFFNPCHVSFYLCPLSCVLCPLCDELLLRIFVSVLLQLVSINTLLLTTHFIRMHNRVAITLRLRVRRNFLRRFSLRITGKRAGDSPVKSPQMNLSRVLNIEKWRQDAFSSKHFHKTNCKTNIDIKHLVIQLWLQ